MTVLPDPAAGCFAQGVHRLALRVYFEDTDLSGMVYHANYLRWFERARSDMLRLLGIDQHGALMAGEGVYAVSEVAIRYLAPARLDDAVIIESHAEEVRAASCRIAQRALRHGPNGEQVLCEASVRVAFVTPEGRPRRQPEAWLRAFAEIVRPPASPTLEGA